MTTIIKSKNGFKVENPENIDSMTYEERQQLVKDIKIFTEYVYGYVDKFGKIIPVKSYNNLVRNLGIGSMFNLKTLLVIQ